MIQPIRRAYHHWLNHSTGTGMLARRLRRHYNRLTRGRHRVGNIAMLHAGRCGSSVLADLLDQHPDVCWANEPFEDMIPAYYAMDSDERGRQVIADRMYRSTEKYFGFDSKYLPEQHLAPALANKTPAQYVALLTELGFNYFILLDRKNHLRRAVSVAIGTVTGTWNSVEQPAQPPKVRVELQRFVSYGREMPLTDYFASLEQRYAELRGLLASRALLELTYEADIEADPRVAYRRSCEFLGLVERPVDVRLKRMNPRPLADLVSNFDEIAGALRGTRYEWMLAA